MNYYEEIKKITISLRLEEGHECEGCPREEERFCANIQCLEILRKRLDESV